MQPASTELLIIFTKNPQLGKVKTRLAKDIGEEAALEIYKFLLLHTFQITLDLPVDKRVYYSEAIPEEDIWKKDIFQKKLQHGEDLGEKMQNAFAEGYKDGYQNIIIIGSDLYELSAEDLSEAFADLQQKDFVVGPAKDGGYYLLGMKQLRPEIFSNKKWSTSTVLPDTLKDLQNENLKLLAVRNDVDTFEDIREQEAFQQFLPKNNQ
ncbi:TIGR04282 family arsenosugar biosynthesis glycosyltransferase [Antarcticibacterium sp. 1MA-6-2]|uniref:TIGR04282 family arsenosugar biosynthesis glycosyltransferase n=1 Tax=Antarcticibacterium sp. 1MA-6-2 TaxID=2908210 RepID=UPI001F01A47C|nr:TIGR04282 family arsenosugar biosynthesis glycosyltransferase [Antarcticibacterium sp. 1MA-6-2]UJH89881.1 TIGR04282 family arsenosugar biosynthesis glycosyltransferase [Antarcticibacterium sp. 1MA-6-2]